MQNPISRAFHPYNHTTTSLGTQFRIDEISHILHSSIFQQQLQYYTPPSSFPCSSIQQVSPPRFLGSEDITNFFSRAQRSRIVFEILCTTPFGREKKGEVGVRSLVDQGAFSAAFPLHDVSSFIQVPPPMLVTYIFPGGLQVAARTLSSSRPTERQADSLPVLGKV